MFVFAEKKKKRVLRQKNSQPAQLGRNPVSQPIYLAHLARARLPLPDSRTPPVSHSPSRSLRASLSLTPRPHLSQTAARTVFPFSLCPADTTRQSRSSPSSARRHCPSSMALKAITSLFNPRVMAKKRHPSPPICSPRPASPIPPQLLAPSPPGCSQSSPRTSTSARRIRRFR